MQTSGGCGSGGGGGSGGVLLMPIVDEQIGSRDVVLDDRFSAVVRTLRVPPRAATVAAAVHGRIAVLVGVDGSCF